MINPLGRVVRLARDTGRVSNDVGPGEPPAGRYQPLTLRRLGTELGREPEEMTRRRLVLEFLDEWRSEPRSTRHDLLAAEPEPTGDEHLEALLGALAEYCATLDDHGAPAWADDRVLDHFWFPDNTPAARTDAIVRAPAAFRRRGVFIAADDLHRV